MPYRYMPHINIICAEKGYLFKSSMHVNIISAETGVYDSIFFKKKKNFLKSCKENYFLHAIQFFILDLVTEIKIKI